MKMTQRKSSRRTIKRPKIMPAKVSPDRELESNNEAKNDDPLT